MCCVINRERVKVIGELLSELGFEGIVKFDLKEPEYKAFKTLYDAGEDPKYIALIAIMAGTVDYQLAKGGAERFWKTLVESYEKIGKIDNLDDVRNIISDFMDKPINKRLNNIKKRRVNTLFRSGFAEWFLNNYNELINEPIKAWSKLAYTLNTGMERKTMVFAMKAWDIAHLICHGDYLDFPWTIPIPVDYHVKNISISSGIISPCDQDDPYRTAWHEVFRIVRNKIDKHLTLLRIDSLVWQSGKIISSSNFTSGISRQQLYKYFSQEIGLNDEISKKLVNELTMNLYKLQR